jgi:Right handed beta helix region
VLISAVLSLNNAVIEHTNHGLQVDASNVQFNGLNFTNNFGGSIVRFTGSNATFAASFFTGGNLISLNSVVNVTFINCTFDYGGFALSMNSANGITVQQCSFKDNDVGINIFSSQDIKISNCSFNSNYQAVQLSLTSLPLMTSVDILGNIFDSNGIAVYALLRQNSQLNVANNIFRNSTSVWLYDGTSGIYANLEPDCRLTIHGNDFSNLHHSGLRIVCAYGYTIAEVLISKNNFRFISGTVIVLRLYDSTVMSIEYNKFEWNTCQMCPSALDLNYQYVSYSKEFMKNFSVSYNQFEENSGNFIINANMYCPVVTPGSDFSRLLFIYNTLVNNLADTAVMYSNCYLLDVVFNIFSNARSAYEFQVGFTDSIKENCTYNWWHASDSAGVQNRIFDHSIQTALGSVVFEPFLNSSQFDCAAVSQCSQHGSCILPDTCRCEYGWKGTDCSQVSCSNVENCNDHGVCVGPNICGCDDGWTSVDCSTPTCYRVNNCGYPTRGTCIAPNRLSTAGFNYHLTIYFN